MLTAEEVRQKQKDYMSEGMKADLIAIEKTLKTSANNIWYTPKSWQHRGELINILISLGYSCRDFTDSREGSFLIIEW